MKNPIPSARATRASLLAAGLLLAGTTTASAIPSFTIESPAGGATVTSPVRLEVQVQGAQIGYPLEGLDHLHVSVDGGPEIAIYRNRPLSVPLPAGQHTISVDLAGPTHEGLLPPKTTTFTVR